MGNFQDPEGGTGQRRYGGPARAVLVVEAAPLLLRMAEVARSVSGVQLVGSFSRAAEVLDWLVWDRPSWHLAYVDLSMRQGSSEEVVQRLHASGRGTIVGISDHMWRETRATWAPHGVAHLVEKGDVIAFRSDLENRARTGS
jgi:DNA-binding NarL/FixJ family response regulator